MMLINFEIFLELISWYSMMAFFGKDLICVFVALKAFY